ncbi:hypothetical protein D9M72_178090 [compost metagenome]
MLPWVPVSGLPSVPAVPAPASGPVRMLVTVSVVLSGSWSASPGMRPLMTLLPTEGVSSSMLCVSSTAVGGSFTAVIASVPVSTLLFSGCGPPALPPGCTLLPSLSTMV